MVLINELVRPREEVLTEGIEGRVDVYKALSGEGIEGDAQKFLEVTYLTEPLKEVIDEIRMKLEKKKGSKGVYAFAGGFGSGKSHHILSLYHMFATSEVGKKWLRTQEFDFEIPTNVKSVLVQALKINPDYLWEPIFEALGHKDLNEKIKRFPTHDDIKKAINSESVMIFLDEIEPWFDALKDEQLENRNLNFLQNLIEVASNTETKLFVFICILPESLVRTQAIKGKVNRDFIYWKNLYEIKEKDQIILYRLFHIEDKKANEEKIENLIEDMISKYRQSGIFKDKSIDTRKRIDEFKENISRSYPFHPQVLETLFDKYGSSTAYQRTRGVLYLLSRVIKDYCDKKEIILLSDINPEKYSDLSKLDTDLSEKAVEDIRKTRELRVKFSDKIIPVVFVKSLGVLATQGASKEDVLYGCIDSSININEIDTGLLEILSTAPHIHEREGKYILQKDINVLVLIENEARLLKDKPTISERIAEIIKDEIKVEKVKAACYEIDGIEDKNQTKIVFSLVEKSEDELREIFASRTYQNRIIFVNPKCKDVLKSNGLNMNIARIIAIDEMLPKFDKYKKTLESRKEHNLLETKKKLKEKYGKFIHWQDSGTFMPVAIEFDSGKIAKKLEEIYDLSTFKEKIMFLLNKREIGETLTVGDVKTHFYKTRGFPVVLDEALFKKAIESLNNEEKVVVVSGSDVYRKGKVIVVLRDDYIIAKPDEVEEEKSGVGVDERTTIKMRAPIGVAVPTEKPYSTETPETLETLRSEAKVPQGLEEFNFEDFTIEESKPWSLQSHLESELDESRDVREIDVALKGKFKGKDMKNIINEMIEKHEDEIISMKISAKVIKND